MIQLTYEINDARTRLTLRLRPEEKEELADLIEEHGSCSPRTESEVMEHMLCNSELDWVTPEECGDLTCAPMIGLRNEEGAVTERWAFEPYCVRAFEEDLRDTGEAVFSNDW